MVNYNTVCEKQKSNRRPTRMYLRLQDKVEIMQACNSDAVILYEYYLSKAGVEEFELSDEKAAIALRWSLRKIQEVRKKLVKEGFFLQKKGRYTDGRKIITTYLGRSKTAPFRDTDHFEKIEDTELISNILKGE